LDTVSLNVCPVLFYVSTFMVISNVDFLFPGHSHHTCQLLGSYAGYGILWTIATWQFWHHRCGGPYMLY
jgi:hypothetical protein